MKRAWVVAILVLAAPAILCPAAQAEVQDVQIEVEILAGGQFLRLTSAAGENLTESGLNISGVGAGTDVNNILKRASFGEVNVDYFIGNAFELTCYTDDGLDPSGFEPSERGNVALYTKPGLLGEDGGTRMLFRAWSPGFGPDPNLGAYADQNNSPVPKANVWVSPDMGINTNNVMVPNPRINELWNRDARDNDARNKLSAVWAFVGDQDSRDPNDPNKLYRVMLSTSKPRDGGTEPRIQAPPFPVYFAVDLLGLKAQRYNGTLKFELKSL